MKPYRGPSVSAGENVAAAADTVADEEKVFAVCRRRKVRRAQSQSSDGLRGPPVFFTIYATGEFWFSTREFRNDPKRIYPRWLIRFFA